MAAAAALVPPPWVTAALGDLPLPLDTPAALRRALHVCAGTDLPLPGSGQTLERWRALAEVAAIDVGLGRLYEAHTDALAILAELDGPPAGGVEPTGDGAGGRRTWGVWAAEAPQARLCGRPAGGAAQARDAGPADLVLDGAKAWCSGSTIVDSALVTCWGPGGERLLAAVRLDHPGVRPVAGTWASPALAATETLEVTFAAVPAVRVGDAGSYLDRAGFWHGGAGVAAAWWGGAVGVASALRQRVTDGKADAHAAADLGAVDVALAGGAAVLREVAAGVDAQPSADAQGPALRARAAAEAAVTLTVDRVGRALGAGPLCRDAVHARRVVDLSTYVRQSHGDRDLATLAATLGSGTWSL